MRHIPWQCWGEQQPHCMIMPCTIWYLSKLVMWVIPCTIWEGQTKLATCDLWHAPFERGQRVTLLINNGAKFHDVQGSNDNNIPVDEDNGFYTSPLQQRTDSIQLLALQSQAEEATRLRKEVGAANSARRESAVARLACINPSCLPLLLPTARWTGAEIDGTTPIDTSVVKTIGFYAKGFGNGMNARKCSVRTWVS